MSWRLIINSSDSLKGLRWQASTHLTQGMHLGADMLDLTHQNNVCVTQQAIWVTLCYLEFKKTLAFCSKLKTQNYKEQKYASSCCLLCRGHRKQRRDTPLEGFADTVEHLSQNISHDLGLKWRCKIWLCLSPKFPEMWIKFALIDGK